MKDKKEQFRIICPKCQGEEVSIAYTIYDEIRLKCENKECEFKEYN